MIWADCRKLCAVVPAVAPARSMPVQATVGETHALKVLLVGRTSTIGVGATSSVPVVCRTSARTTASIRSIQVCRRRVSASFASTGVGFAGIPIEASDAVNAA